MNLNLGDIYAILTAFCWSFAVILFDISSKKLNSLQMSFIKNFIGVLGFILTVIILNLPSPDFSKLIEEENFNPSKGPFTYDELRNVDVGDVFIDYLRSWKGFIIDKP